MPSSLRQVAAVYINKGRAALANFWHVNPRLSWGTGLRWIPLGPVCKLESCISCRCQAQSELPCQDVLGQLSAICVTVHISANKLLLLSVVLCLPSAVLLGTLPARERATACTRGGWVAPLVICVLHGVLIGFVDGSQGVSTNIMYQSMTF